MIFLQADKSDIYAALLNPVGKFAFNTLDPARIDAAAASGVVPVILRPEIGLFLCWWKE